MHLDMVVELQRRPAKNRRAQQVDCDHWRLDFNFVRPHDALGGRTPADVYRVAAPRALEARLPTYPPEWRTRRVNASGSICVEGDKVLLGQALAGQLVGLQHEGALRWHAYFFDVDLGTVELAPLGLHHAITGAQSTSTTPGDTRGDTAVSA